MRLTACFCAAQELYAFKAICDLLCTGRQHEEKPPHATVSLPDLVALPITS